MLKETKEDKVLQSCDSTQTASSFTRGTKRNGKRTEVPSNYRKRFQAQFACGTTMACDQSSKATCLATSYPECFPFVLETQGDKSIPNPYLANDSPQNKLTMNGKWSYPKRGAKGLVW